MRIRTKTNLPQLLFALFVVALLFIVAWVAKEAITGGHTATGHLIGYDYSPGTGASVSSGMVNNEPAVIMNAGTSPQYVLLLEVDGHTSSYYVGADTYALAVKGQTEFLMLCSNVGCVVAE